MVSFIEAIVLGAVQGVTEWLPVSSSGHLALLSYFMGVEQPVFFALLLHLATLVVIVMVFHREIRNLLLFNRKSMQTLFLLAVGTLPIAVLGYYFADLIRSAFVTPLLVGLLLAVNGAYLLFLDRLQAKKERIHPRNALVTGAFQALALFPGVSRSGMTIFGSVVQGIKREQAVVFSFLLAIPAIIGAALHELLAEPGLSFEPAMLVGMLVAIVVGYFSLRWLIVLVKQRRMKWFGVYCILIGILAILISR